MGKLWYGDSIPAAEIVSLTSLRCTTDMGEGCWCSGEPGWWSTHAVEAIYIQQERRLVSDISVFGVEIYRLPKLTTPPRPQSALAVILLVQIR